MSLAIRKNVPIPDNRSKYPFDTMDVGDSIFVNDASRDYGNGANVYAAVRKYQTKTGRKFVSRKVKGGFGIWRVS